MNSEKLLTPIIEALSALSIQPLDTSRPAAIPENMRVENLEHLLPQPRRARGDLSFQRLISLLDYVERHVVRDSTAIFADAAANKIVGVINWHAPIAAADSELPGWGDHTATYEIKHTPEYVAWTSINGRTMSQTAFVEFLEEHLDDIAEPSPLDLFTQVSKLSGKRNIQFESSKKLENGDVAVEWKEDTVTNNGSFPSKFTIKIPVYRGAEKATTFEIRALLRYRIDAGKLQFEVKLLHVDKIRDLAFDQLLGSIQTTVSSWAEKAPIYTGSITKRP